MASGTHKVATLLVQGAQVLFRVRVPGAVQRLSRA